MFKIIFSSLRAFFELLADAFYAFREANVIEKAAAVIASILIVWVLKIGYGTFIIDHALLLVMGYVCTYNIYKTRGKQWNYGVAALKFPNVGFYRWRKKFMDRFWLMTFPLSVLSLWIGGFFPYINAIPPESVYCYAFPKEWLGINGQDFMWNGFIIALFDKRIIPLEFLPTWKYPLFNAYAGLYWASIIFFLGFGVAKGRQTAFTKVYSGHSKFLREFAKIFTIAVFWFMIDMAMARFLLWWI